MSLPPITIDDLDPASSINQNTDLMIIRQGLKDAKATPVQVFDLNLSSFAPLPSPLVQSDVLLVGRNVSGVYQKYLINPQKIGFMKGTCTWFYQNSAPLGWTVIPGTGDRILATALAGGDPYQYTVPGQQGTWQQEGVVLTVQQIPNHRHFGQFGQNQSNANARYIHGASSLPSGGDPRYGDSPVVGMVGAYNDNSNHNNYGACLPHNHGFTWRPAANVGLLCVFEG